MNLAFGLLFIYLGAAGLWVAFHGTDATTPWAAVQSLTKGGGTAAAAGATADDATDTTGDDQ